MKISIGQTISFSKSRRAALEGTGKYVDFREITTTAHLPEANGTRGIFAYGENIEKRISPRRTPVIICTSNPVSGSIHSNPWLDVVEPDEGYALFNGDNKWPGQDPFIGKGRKIPLGNRKFLDVAELYKDKSRRIFAPPVVVFRHIVEGGRRSGLREFCGVGVPVQFSLRTQRIPETRKYFTNLVIELTLFDLTRDDGMLNWQWIEDRGNPELSAEEALRNAPSVWQTWVRGEEVEQCRRSVVRDRIVARQDQRPIVPDDSASLARILDFYADRPRAFEGLAALVTARLIGQRCERMWVNVGQGDGGVDFVCLLKVGNPELKTGETGVVVIGQAKRWDIDRPVTPDDVSRLAARLRRGWIGAFVSTSYFTDQAQSETLADGYPLLLINGRTVAAEVNKYLNETGSTIEEFLTAELAWYERRKRPWNPARAMEAFNIGVVVDLPQMRRTRTISQ